MPVYHVIKEYYPEESKEIIEEHQYVDAESIYDVAKYFEELEASLPNIEIKSIKEVFTIPIRIPRSEVVL